MCHRSASQRSSIVAYRRVVLRSGERPGLHSVRV